MSNKVKYHPNNGNLTFASIFEKPLGLERSFGLSAWIKYDIACYFLNRRDFRSRLSEKDKAKILRVGNSFVSFAEPYENISLFELPKGYWIKFAEYVRKMWQILHKYIKPGDLQRTDFP